ncbi:MAG: 6-carboxytetrahydropterin synthase [Cytophagaceae bacterium]|nr:6-carboxytetrahydropterin synthase [Cytophagaceae bacterium]MBK9933015.1 6-carboxytetrahydropterin synthase [Cytophagaceae bacterium]MBL0303268.1 6-carboxytetrahydropterin synthase [Cytophagaceae bacterium]MBL0326120.1 6-carboxytetrahydropterin synthase [Cytophagaceae bacterium]
MKRVSVFRREHFNAAHKIYNPEWSDEKNLEVFGKCSYANYHGHNYEMEVKLTGEINPKTGYVFDLKVLSELLKAEIVELFDHKNLNLDIPVFKELIPTAENICVVIYEILREKIDQKFDIRVRLFETERNYVEYPA